MATGKSITDEDLNGRVAVGKVREAHGLKGELFLIFYAREAPWIEKLDTLTFVQTVMDPETKENTRQLFEFRKTRFKTHKIGAIAKVEGVEDRDEAEFLKGAIIYVPGQLLTSRPGEMVYLREVLGFEVRHETLGLVGRVSGFSSNGAQDLLVVLGTTGDSQFEIPFIEHFVTRIVWEAKSISMSFPDELLATAQPLPKKKGVTAPTKKLSDQPTKKSSDPQ